MNSTVNDNIPIIKMIHNVGPPNLTLSNVDIFYVWISNLTAITSIASCFVILTVFVLYKEIRTTSRLLLVLLSCADFFVNVATLLQTTTYYRSILFPSEKSFFCQAAAGIFVYSQVSASLWTVALTLFLYLNITGHYVKNYKRLLIFFNVFCWLLPLVVSLSGDLAGVYGYNITDILMYKHPVPCWIGNKVKNPLSWYFMTSEGWVIAAYVIVSLIYFAISWSVYCKKTRGKQITGDNIAAEIEALKANEQLRFIPVIYVCTRIWGTGYFFFTHYPDTRHLRSSDWLMVIKAFGDNSQGLVNAIFFCLITKQIRQILAAKLHKYCKCFYGLCSRHSIIGNEKWIKVQSIVRTKGRMQRRSRNLDGSDIDLTGISLDLPTISTDQVEDEVIFEQ